MVRKREITVSSELVDSGTAALLTTRSWPGGTAFAFHGLLRPNVLVKGRKCYYRKKKFGFDLRCKNKKSTRKRKSLKFPTP